MIRDVAEALAEIFTLRFRTVLWKVLGLTLAILALAIGALHHILLGFVHLPYPWLQTTLSVLAGLSLVVGSVFLVAPISALVAGFFIDDLAHLVEHDIDPWREPGRPLPTATALGLSLRFALISTIATALALVLLLVPGLNAVAFLGANTFLLGWQYFEFAALRFRTKDDADALRHRHWPTILLAGLCIAGFVTVPVLNLLTPLFGTALMVRVHKRVSGQGLLPRR